jgi:3-deoxy-D-manno-octulosonic-acid transferase
MTWTLVAYQAAIALLRGTAPLIAFGSRKFRRGLKRRSDSASTFTIWARAHRDPARPLVLFHAASAGELRQAEPVIRRIRTRRPLWQLAVTTFSPSGIAVAESLPVDICGFLPWDADSPVAEFLDALTPAALVVSKLDLWPVFALAAHARGIRLGLIAGTVRSGSGRLRWPARRVLAPAYAALDAVAAVGAEDAQRLARLGVRSDRITLDGDPRCDAVLERIAAVPRPPQDQFTLVAGSTWPPDEQVLLAAFRGVRRDCNGARMILVPHEPSPEVLDRIDAQARRLGLPPPRRFREASASDPLVVVDEVGSLAFLYGMGVIAYVGGGFGSAGLHSVLEPAAWGVPVIVGPAGRDHPDLALLSAVHAVERLPTGDPGGALERCWRGWLEQPEAREEAGRAALRAIRERTGAADRCADLVEQLVDKQ